MNIAVCDDEKSSLENIAAEVISVGLPYEVFSFLKIEELFQRIKDGVKFDAVLMDIEWYGEQKGIGFAAELYNVSPKTRIIFITGYPERYSQQIFLRNANLKGFIAKPIEKSILHKNLVKIKDELIAEENRKLLLKFNGVIISVAPENILYIESRSPTVTVYATDREYICYDKLDVLIKRLPRSFIFTHKSFLVNMDRIWRIERERVILENNVEIPISKSRQNEVRDNYFRYVSSVL